MGTNTVKHLLAISWCMPPFLSPRSIQVSRTLHELSVLGWNITVLTAKPIHSPGFSQENKLPQAESLSYRVIPIPVPERFLTYRIAQQLLPSFCWTPDRNMGWINAAASAGHEELMRTDYDAIISFSHPISDHIIGQRLHNITAIPWIAHFSDPWLDSPFYQPASAKHDRRLHEIERTIIKSASKVIFTSRQTQDKVMAKYPTDWKEKTDVIPHGFDTRAQAVSAPTAEDDCFRLVHTGRFYKRYRTPGPLIAAMRTLQRNHQWPAGMEFHFAGAMPSKYRQKFNSRPLADVATYHGQLDYIQNQSLMQIADVFLLVDAPCKDESMFLPSKLIDYLPYKKPILGITPAQGASADLLQQLQCPVVDPDDPYAIVAALIDLFEQWRSGELRISTEYHSIYRQYDIRQTTASFEHILSVLVEHHHEIYSTTSA